MWLPHYNRTSEVGVAYSIQDFDHLHLQDFTPLKPIIEIQWNLRDFFL